MTTFHRMCGILQKAICILRLETHDFLGLSHVSEFNTQHLLQLTPHVEIYYSWLLGFYKKQHLF